MCTHECARTNLFEEAIKGTRLLLRHLAWLVRGLWWLWWQRMTGGSVALLSLLMLLLLLLLLLLLALLLCGALGS